MGSVERRKRKIIKWCVLVCVCVCVCVWVGNSCDESQLIGN